MEVDKEIDKNLFGLVLVILGAVIVLWSLLNWYVHSTATVTLYMIYMAIILTDGFVLMCLGLGYIWVVEIRTKHKHIENKLNKVMGGP